MTDTPATERPRLHGLDLLRLLSFLAIVVHHFVTIIFYELDAPPAFTTNPLLHVWQIQARAMSFSGQTILFLSSFLIARAESREWKTWKVVLWATLGWIAFCIFDYSEGSLFFWTWDIYPLIMLGLGSAVLVKRLSLRLVYVLGAAGFALTMFDFWNWPAFGRLPYYWRHVLIGECAADAAYWPVLPWVGIIWAGYAWGAFERSRIEKASPSVLSVWHRAETFVWPLLMLASLPVLGSFYSVKLGPGFACYVFRQAPHVFWGNFLFVVFAMRISLLSSVQQTLNRFRFAHWVGRLRISRNFGIAYLVHYTLLVILEKTLRSEIRDSETLLFILVISVLPVTEMLLRLGVRVSHELTRRNREGSV